MNTTLALVPVWLLDRPTWIPLENALGRSLPTLAAMGFGDNDIVMDQATTWSFEAVVSELRKQVQSFTEPPILVSCSGGATAALAVAASDNVATAGVVSIGGSARWVVNKMWPYGYDPAALPGFLEAMRTTWLPTLEQAIETIGLLDDDSPRRRGAFRAALEAAGRVRVPSAMVKILERILEVDLRESLGQIGCPVLLVHGERDPIAPPALGEWMAERIPQARIAVIPGAGHLAHMSAPEPVAGAIGDFCRELFE